MEMLPLFIYLAGIVDQVNTVMTLISTLLIVAIFGLICYLLEYETKSKSDAHIVQARWKFCRKLIYSLIICGTIGLLSPNEKTMYAVAGTYGAVRIIQAPESKELFEKSLKAINLKLDEYIESNKSKENK